MNDLQLKVLLLEDNADLAEMEIDELVKNHYQVTWCKNLEEFKAIPNLTEHFLIISDLYLPDGNSLDVLAEVKSRNIHLPVVCQTGSPTVDLAVKAFELGAIAFLQKPFTITQLSLIVQKYELTKRWTLSNPTLADKAKFQFGLVNIG